MTDNNFNYDSFVRNPPNPLDIDNLSLQDSLSSSISPTPSPRNAFNISSFNINGLKTFSHNKIELLNDFFSLKHISFGHVKLRIFVVYIPPTSDQSLRDETIDLLIRALSDVKRLGFHHAVCGNFNMHLDQFYPIFFNQPQIASKRIHCLFNFLLSNGYVDFTLVNFSSASLGTFHRANIISRIDYVWSSRARQLKRHSRRIFSFDSVTLSQWDDFSVHIDRLCNISPTVFASWHINRMCEYLHANIIAGANVVLPARTVGNDHTPKLPKDLETLIQHYRFLNRVLHSIKLLRKYPHTLSSSHDRKWSGYLIRLNSIFKLYNSTLSTVPVLPSSLFSCWTDNFNNLFQTLSHVSKLLRGLHLLKEKEFQDSSIKAHLETRDQNFDTDISSFINSALSRSRHRIVLDRVFVDHPTTPQLLTDPKDVFDAVVNHFQHAVPIKSTPPSHISALSDRWCLAYSPMDTVSPDIYNSLLSPPSLEEWLSTVSSMPNGKVPDPFMITYEMLKHLGPTTNSLLLLLIRKCFASADIPDLWRQAMVFPISKPHEWRCQLKNTRPITLLEVIRKSFVKLFYIRLSAILAAHNVLKGGNFAGLLGRTCRDSIITLESIIHDANHNNSPLWILSQDISKAFDSVNLTMLKFVLERIRLPALAITLILSFFMNRSNRVFTAYGETSSYQVCIGIDQGEVISPLLWVIYIDPLLTVLKTEMLDPYILRPPTLSSNMTNSIPDIFINNLIFMNDSTLISSSKAGLEHMLSITEEFYALNNTSANHQKYVLITNSLPLTTTSTISPVEFHLSLSSLNEIPFISVTPLSITSSFRFLGVWFNIKSSRDFVKKQIAGECNSFAATLRPARLSAKQIVYLYNSVLIPKLEYRLQVTHLSATDCYVTTRSIRSLVKHKANFFRSLPNPILYLSHALELINLSSHLVQCHVNNLFLMANSSTSLIQRLFVYRLMLIQFRFLISLSPLMVDDWFLWSAMTAFKCDYIACTIASMTSTPFRLQHAHFSSATPDLTLPSHTPLYTCMSPHVFKACLKVLRKRHLYYLSQLIAPSGSHLISWTAYWTAYLVTLADKHGRSLPHKWYLDIKTNTTLPDSHDQLLDRFVCPPSALSSVTLVPGVTTMQKNRHWLVTLDGSDSPLFGKQLSVQPKKDTCMIVHWISDCLSSPGDVICLCPCPGCDAHVPFSSANKYTAVPPRCTFKISLLKSLILPTDCERIQQTTMEVTSPYSWADLSFTVIPYYRRLDTLPDFSFSSSVVGYDSTVASSSLELSTLPFPVPLPSGSHYRYYTDGSLVNLGTPEVSMGWSWVQLIPDAGYLNSVATYAHGTIRNWPSSTRAEAAAIYTALRVSPDDSTITIYTDSQASIDGLNLCVSSTYTNSRLYYKTTNFELWASIESSIRSKRLTVLPVKVKGHDGNYWNEFPDSLVNSAHHSDMTPLLPAAEYTSSHDVRLVYDNIVCESNPRRLFKLYFQATFLKDLLSLKRFQFIYCLNDKDDYIVDWELTWFTLNFFLAYDASFQASHTARHYAFKFKLFLDDLPLLEKLKITRSDLYIDLLTCRSCHDRMEDLMHLILCSKRRSIMHQILQSYQNHLFSKLREAGELADMDPTPLLRKLSSLSCWTISSSNWSYYALIQGCLPHNVY
ncbi:hypothetical protein RclHR1_12140006 [Rhizophagus clarus]|uniref:RNA-directed DNA polymerase from mobile element jockey-like n=1 Tax=Rhizophagus clarus TaxID=94130 RepID=A0A2Z6Q6B7_9GLOM|nr:hypothetical protein RclHR1_12140006 [Rhizophagus clarus]